MKKSKLEIFAYFPDSFADHLADNVEAINELSRLNTLSLTSLLWENLRSEKRYRHALHRDCFFVPHERLQRAFGKQYIEILTKTGLIDIYAKYDQVNGHARAYKLTQLAYDTFDVYRIDNSITYMPAIQTKIIDKTGGTMRIGKSTNAIRSIDSDNLPSKFLGRIDPLVKINLDGVHTVQVSLDNVREWIYQDNKPSKTTEIEEAIHARLMRHRDDMTMLEHAIISYQNLIGQINIVARQINREPGLIPVLYTEIKSGRLYGDGLNPQTWQRELRKAAFNGQCDYDLENCHYAIFSQLAKQQGISTPSIDYYLENKRIMRKAIAEAVGISTDDAKQCLIALIYGARLSTRKGNAIPELIGTEKAAKLFKCLSYTDLYADIKKARKSILKAHMKPQGLINAMRKTITRGKLNYTTAKQVAGKNKKVDLLSHVVQGYEAKMQEIAVQLHGETITLLQHDGFTSTNRNIDIDALCREIERQTGLKMSMVRELLENPSIKQLNCLASISA
jgi:macrodomain Ter protein organizer (MatP/YcbG family)